VNIEMADFKTFYITRNGEQVSMMQWDGTTQWIFLSVWLCRLLWQSWKEMIELPGVVAHFKSSADTKPEY